MGEALSFSSNGSVWWTANWENAKEEEYIDTLSEQLKTLVNWISILNSANAVFEGIQDVTKGDMHCGFIDTPNSPRTLRSMKICSVTYRFPHTYSSLHWNRFWNIYFL